MGHGDDEETLLALVTAARADDPSIEPTAAAPLAQRCLQMMTAEPGLSTAELARRMVAENPQADPSWINHIARAVLTYLQPRK